MASGYGARGGLGEEQKQRVAAGGERLQRRAARAGGRREQQPAARTGQQTARGEQRPAALPPLSPLCGGARQRRCRSGGERRVAQGRFGGAGLWASSGRDGAAAGGWMLTFFYLFLLIFAGIRHSAKQLATWLFRLSSVYMKFALLFAGGQEEKKKNHRQRRLYL